MLQSFRLKQKSDLLAARYFKAAHIITDYGVGCIMVFYRVCLCLANPIFITKKHYISEDKTIKIQNNVNEMIRHPEVRLIGANGEQLGIVSSQTALDMAYQANLDLVEISPQATPPVCKIMDYGKFRFETLKKQKEAKKNQKVIELKEIWLSMTIDVGDMNVKAKQTMKFLSQGNKVKVSIRLRGRQNAHSSLGIDVMNEFFELVKSVAVMEKKPLLEGRNILMILAPLKEDKKTAKQS